MIAELYKTFIVWNIFQALYKQISFYLEKDLIYGICVIMHIVIENVYMHI